MSGGGPTTGTSTTKAVIPKELKPLYTQTAGNIMGMQTAAPLQPFTGSQPLNIAPLNQYQQYGLGLIGDITKAPQGESIALADLLKLPEYASRVPTGEGIETSPAVLAARRAYEQNIAPSIVNQNTLAGLGRTTATGEALAKAGSEYMLPVIQEELARQERGIDRGTQAMMSKIQSLLGISGSETNRLTTALSAALSGGETARSVEQAANVASLEDYLRRQGLAEQALYTPFTALGGQSIGQSTTQTSSGSGGGLFK